MKPNLAPSTDSRRTTSKDASTNIAYVMSRFPKITETFILYEMLAMEDLGLDVKVYPLLRERTKVMHPEAVSFVQRANFRPYFTLEILFANVYYMFRKPRAYFGALGTSLAATWGSLRFFFGVLAFFPKIVAFARQMAAEQVDHIHAHFASHPAAAAYVIHRLTGIPYSFTAHGSDLHRDRHMLREKVADAEFVVAISQFNRRIIIDECGDEFQDKVVVIHCGVDTSALHPKESTTPANRASRPLSIACVGTLHEVKGQTFLIEACRLLKQRGIDVRLHLVGDGPDLEALRTQADKAGLKRIVTFHGRKIRQEVIDILQDADVVAAPSVPTKDGRREGIPVALMEAMSCGLAVVASRLSGIPELVQDGESGILVPYGDARALAEALAHLHQHPELCEQLGRAAREVILREFDLRANAAAIARRCGAAVPEIHEHEPAAIDPAAALRETLA